LEFAERTADKFENNALSSAVSHACPLGLIRIFMGIKQMKKYLLLFVSSLLFCLSNQAFSQKIGLGGGIFIEPSYFSDIGSSNISRSSIFPLIRIPINILQPISTMQKCRWPRAFGSLPVFLI